MTSPAQTLAPDASRRGPVRQTERSLAPDLARGAMLLFIALANAGNVSFAGGPGLDPHPHGLARVWNAVDLLLVDARAYPVFAVMFGYGLVQLARRHEERGTDPRRVLLRRNAALVALGAVHGTLLYFGDFLGAYGVVGLVASLLLLRRSERFHRIVLGLWVLQLGSVAWLAFLALTGHGGSAGFTNVANPSLSAPSYARSVVERLGEWPAHTLQVLPFIVIVWLGMWAARRGILEHPQEHRRLLTATAVGGLGIAIVGGLPYALVGAGVLHADPITVAHLTTLSNVAGEYAGPGYVALFGLLTLHVRREQPVVGAIAALGQRSLSGYLLQSCAWLVLFAPYLLDLGGSDGAAVLAGTGIWVLSVVAARALERRGDRGPAERLLRRLTYGAARSDGRA